MFAFLGLSSVEVNSVLEFVSAEDLLKFVVVFAHKTIIMENVKMLTICDPIDHKTLKLSLYNHKIKHFEVDQKEMSSKEINNDLLEKILTKLCNVEILSFVNYHPDFMKTILLALKQNCPHTLLEVRIGRSSGGLDDSFLQEICNNFPKLSTLHIEYCLNYFTLNSLALLVSQYASLSALNCDELEYNRGLDGAKYVHF